MSEVKSEVTVQNHSTQIFLDYNGVDDDDEPF